MRLFCAYVVSGFSRTRSGDVSIFQIFPEHRLSGIEAAVDDLFEQTSIRPRRVTSSPVG